MSQQQDIMNNLLIEAVRNRNLTQAKLYVQKGADPNCMASGISITEKSSITQSMSRSTSGPVLHLAGTVGGSGFSHDMTDFLISAGAKVDAKNNDGNTMLMVAIKSYSADAAEYWLSKGANPLATDSRGNLTLKLAMDIDSAAAVRQPIINALMAKMPNSSAENASTSAAPPAAAPAPAASAKDITLMKPAAVVSRRTPQKPRRGGGFTL